MKDMLSRHLTYLLISLKVYLFKLAMKLYSLNLLIEKQWIPYAWRSLRAGHNIKLVLVATAIHSSTLLPGKSQGQRNLEGFSPSMGSLRVGGDWATSLSLLCIGEGNGNPLQCSCLENPGDRGAWWAAVYGVAQSRTRLKRLSSSSSSSLQLFW